MTKEKLNQIIKLKKEVEMLRQKLQELKYGDNEVIVTDKVKGSMSHYPFSARSFTLIGMEQMSEECIKERDAIGEKISDKYHELCILVNDIIGFIHSINDSEIRQILTYRYIDGLTWDQTGQAMNYATITVRKKHDSYIKNISPHITSKAL